MTDLGYGNFLEVACVVCSSTASNPGAIFTTWGRSSCDTGVRWSLEEQFAVTLLTLSLL